MIREILRTFGIFALVTLVAIGCSKKDRQAKTGKFQGHLLYWFTSTVSKLNLNSNTAGTIFTLNTYGFNNWDLGYDGRYRLFSESEAGVYDKAKITLVDNQTGQIADEFYYDAPRGNETRVRAKLSPDNKRVAYQPTLDNGIVISDLEGNIIKHLEGVNTGSGNISLGLGDEVIWLPDNSITFTLGDRFIFRSAPPYSTLSLVKEMPSLQWGNLRVNRQGTQLALQIDGHIQVMDINGDNLHPVSESKGTEMHANFSPDGQFLVVAKKYGDYVYYWNLAIIPNDNNVHDMDGESVYIMQPEGAHIYAAVDAETFWIP